VHKKDQMMELMTTPNSMDKPNSQTLMAPSGEIKTEEL